MSSENENVETTEMTTATTMIQDAPKKRVMSQEALEKLKIAREKALVKRRELAQERKKEIESRIEQKIKMVEEEKNQKTNLEVEKQAKARMREQAKVSEKVKKSRESIVIERDSSDSSSEDDVRDARVYFVRKNKTTKDEAPPAPRVAAPAPAPVDPYDNLYRKMFGGSNINFM